MIACLHHPLPHEKDFIERYDVQTCLPEDIKNNTTIIRDWIKNNNIEFLAIHLDLDVLDPKHFRSVLFAKPGRNEDEFGNVSEGKLNIDDVLNLLKDSLIHSKAIGLTIAEHLPWDAINLKNMLSKLPLMKC